MNSISTGSLAAVFVCFSGPIAAADEHPLSAERRAAIRSEADETIERMTRHIAEDPKDVELYSRRGDARFFRGDFKRAVSDYDKMIELKPRLETSHWRRGIAYFYAGDFQKAAHQFEIYHTFDQVDRENGIWRFLSQAKADGLEKARQGLLKYKKDDREPFPDLYRLFAGEITPDKVLERIASAEISDAEREKRLFYAQLYIGLNYDVENKPDLAIKHIRAAVGNAWGPKAGFGPRYMWQVGRLHYDRLAAARTPGRK